MWGSLSMTTLVSLFMDRVLELPGAVCMRLHLRKGQLVLTDSGLYKLLYALVVARLVRDLVITANMGEYPFCYADRVAQLR